MPQTETFLTIDVGRAWTKVFLVKITENNTVEIEKSSRLPTSHPDQTFSIKTQLDALKEKPENTILVSSLENAETLAKAFSADFVSEEEAAKQLVEFFKKASEKVSILDAGASNFENFLDAKKIGKYLSFSIPETNLENYLGNKSHKPHQLPRNKRELEIEEAFLRNVYEQKLLTENKRNLFLVVTGGLFSDTPDVSRLCLILLDILPENALAEIVFDREFFLPSFGALLERSKRSRVALPGQWLDKLGTFISLGGPKSLKLDWGYSQLQEVELSNEEIAFIPAEKDQRIQVEFSNGKEKIKSAVFGGTLGLVLDARAKPLQLVYGQDASRTRVANWLKEVQKSKEVKEAF